MLTVNDRREPKTGEKLAKEIPMGFFFGRVDTEKGLFLRYFSGIALVENPIKNWEDPYPSIEGWSLMVNEYQPLDAAEVMISIVDKG